MSLRKAIIIVSAIIFIEIIAALLYIVMTNSSNPAYCMKDSECVVDGNNCRAVNAKNFKKSEARCLQLTCGAYCRDNSCELIEDCRP